MDQPNSRKWLRRADRQQKKRQPLGRCACAMCKGHRREGALRRGGYGANARRLEAANDSVYDVH